MLLDAYLDSGSGWKTELQMTQILTWTLHIRDAHVYTQERLANSPSSAQSITSSDANAEGSRMNAQ